MHITVSTAVPRLGYDLAADLETRGFDVSVVTAEIKTFALHHGRAVTPGAVARLLDALQPFQPDAIVRDDDLDADAVKLLLGDEVALDAWEIRLHTDSPALMERCRDMLDSLGYRNLGEELGLQEKNSLVYGGASPFARQVIRWQLRRLGLKVEESRHEEWDDDDDDVLLSLADPALAAVPPLERFGVEVVSDDAEAALVLLERLRIAGFRCLPLALLSETKAREARLTIDPGPFAGETASSDLARLRVFVADLIREQGIDQTRYSLRVGGESKGLSATVTLPLRACRGGTKSPYDGPYPERFDLRIHTDTPGAVEGLRAALAAAGFRLPTVEECPSLLDDEPADGRATEKGFFLVWGAAGKQPEVAQVLQEVVHLQMVEAGAVPTFQLNQIDRFHADDPDVWIYFPVRGVRDGSLLGKLAEPSRFRLKVYCPEPSEWSDLVLLLERRGFAACEAVTRSCSRPSIDYGAAPLPLVESLRDLVRDKSGLTASLRKCWNDSDEDIWIYLPSRPRRDETDEKEDEADALDLHTWLQPLHAERQPFLDATADRLRVGPVSLPRRQGPADTFVPDLRAFSHFCLDALTAETLQHVATSIALREPCLLEGETSTSKTSSILYLAALLNQPVVRINLNGQTDTGELVGRFVPSAEGVAGSASEPAVSARARPAALADAAGSEKAEPFWRWQDGLVVQALRQGWWVLLDEVNLAEPQILERLNSVLEREPSLVLTEYDNSALGSTARPVHPDFRIFATMNPAEYAGRSVLSPAYRDRWRGYRFVPRPGEVEYLAMLRFLVHGTQPEVTVLGQPYAGSVAGDSPPHAALAAWSIAPGLLPALARFHAALERAAGQSEEEAGRLGARRKERYVFTRRGLLSVLQYLTSPLGPGGEQPSGRVVREAIVRYYLGRVSAREDQALVVQLLDAAGLGPNTWSIEP